MAVRLTDFEKQVTVQQHEDKLIIKIFVFYLFDCFLGFFILAFFQIPFGAWVNDRLADLNLELIPFDAPSGSRLGQRGVPTSRSRSGRWSSRRRVRAVPGAPVAAAPVVREIAASEPAVPAGWRAPAAAAAAAAAIGG